MSFLPYLFSNLINGLLSGLMAYLVMSRKYKQHLREKKVIIETLRCVAIGFLLFLVVTVLSAYVLKRKQLPALDLPYLFIPTAHHIIL